MRTIYHTPEFTDALAHHLLRREYRLTLLFWLVIPLSCGGIRPVGHWSWWANILVGYGGMALVATPLILNRIMRRRKAARGESPSVEMMMDDEKIVIEDKGVQITIRLEEITEIIDLKACIIVKKDENVWTPLPAGQLLEHEMKLLDEVKAAL
jgi:hypothetical protein